MIGDFIFSWAENAEGRMVDVDSMTPEEMKEFIKRMIGK